MSTYDFFKLDSSDGIATITLNRPPLNVMHNSMMAEFNTLLESTLARADLAALLVRAEGKAFSAGVDVADHAADKVGEMVAQFHGIFRRLVATDVLTIAAVQGAALGGGCELACFCDIVLASERARFGQPEVQVGVFPPVAACILPAQIGIKKAIELTVVGATIGAPEALRIGLVNQVFPADDFDASVETYLQQIRKLSRPVVRLAKKATTLRDKQQLLAQLQHTERIYLDELMKLEDAHEGIAAFTQKRGGLEARLTPSHTEDERVMKAMVFHGNDVGLKYEDVPVPQIQADEVLIKVAACGVCHTDLHYIEHGVPTFKKPPIVLGHEASGIVHEVGAGVTRVKLGQRVLIPAVLTCGSCSACRLGRENICSNMQMLGNHLNGAYAEFVAVPAKDLLDLPESLPLEESSIIADAISTPYHAVKNRAQVKLGDTVVVFGCGGVGMNAVQLAAAAGGYVIAVDISEKKLEWARQFGAAQTVNAQTTQRVDKEIKRLTDGGADIAMEVIGNPRTIEQAFDCVRPGGRLCVVGYTSEQISVVAGKIMFKEIEVVGSLGCRPVDYVPLIRLVAEGRIDVKKQVTHRFRLNELGRAFEVMKEGACLRSIVVP